MNGRGRQFARGGVGGPEPPRRRRFRGQYVRRRTPSGGYRAGSFSDDRNDSSPPPMNNSQQQIQQQQDEPQYVPPPPHYPQRMQRPLHRGTRHYQPNRNQFYDNHYPRNQNNQNNRTYDGGSDHEYNDRGDGGGSVDQPQQPQQHHHEHQTHRQQHQQNSLSNSRDAPTPSKKLDELSKSFQGQKTDIDEIRVMFSKLNTELEQVKSRVKELELTGNVTNTPSAAAGGGVGKTATNSSHIGKDDLDKQQQRRKAKFLKQREKKAAKLAEKRANFSTETASQQDPQSILNSEQATQNDINEKPKEGQDQDAENTQPQASTSAKYDRRTNRERTAVDKRRVPRREFKEKNPRPLPKQVNKNIVNDDSTTQAAEPSSEDRPEGDDGREGNGKERIKVLRRKKQHFGRRAPYGNRRRRADSSERNSNDTSPQNEVNGDDNYRDKRKKNPKKTFPELSESELNEVLQTLKREFVNSERPLKAIKATMNTKGPKVVFEFAVSILDHAICDVTSPSKLSEIATNLSQLIVSEDNAIEVDFQQGFFDALYNISQREDDIAIDAPRYMDTLGQVLAHCIVSMTSKHRTQIKRFLNRCLDSYCPQNRALLLASIMKGIASTKSDRFAKDIWDTAELNWDKILNQGDDLNEFLETHEVKFTTQEFSPEPKAPKKASKELEKFADDVTGLVEKRCSSQTLDDLLADLNLEAEDRIEYLGTLIYAIVRGCLVTESDDYKLNSEALNQYSSILTTKHEEQDAIALYALTALTKLWHVYNCPQDLIRTLLMALHNQGTASYETLKEWYYSDRLTYIPGIGAARYSSKRYIEDLEASVKS